MGSIWDDRLAEVWAPPGKAGSGVVIGTCGVLTARHVIDAVATSTQTGPVLARVIRRGSPPGAWVPMGIAGEDAAWDLAVLQVDQEAPEAAGWVRPVSGSPVVVTVGGSSERGCELVGFPDEEVQRPDLAEPARWVRQSEQVLGLLLPMGQAKPPVALRGMWPREWMPLDVENATPDVQSGWCGMSGSGVVLPDGLCWSRTRLPVLTRGFRAAMIIGRVRDAGLPAAGDRGVLARVADAVLRVQGRGDTCAPA